MAAAGATPWLVGHDANGIQELITASGRPISMRGASEAILAFDKDVSQGEVSQGELPIFGGGGRGVVLARSREDAERRERALVDRYRKITRGGVMATSAVPLERGGHAEAQSIRWLRHRLELAKDAALPPAGDRVAGIADQLSSDSTLQHRGRRAIARERDRRDGLRRCDLLSWKRVRPLRPARPSRRPRRDRR